MSRNRKQRTVNEGNKFRRNWNCFFVVLRLIWSNHANQSKSVLWMVALWNATGFYTLMRSNLEKDTKDNKTEEPLSQSRADNSSLQSTTGSNDFLQQFPISTRNEKRFVQIIELCDIGSFVSFKVQSLVDLLRLKCKESVMSVAGFHGRSDKKTVFVTGRVAPSETETADEELTFGTHPNLNVGDKSYDFPKTKETYACLTDLPDKKVILGLDAYHLIKSLEYKSPDRKELLAVKT